jgi:hypothetical protein
LQHPSDRLKPGLQADRCASSGVQSAKQVSGNSHPAPAQGQESTSWPRRLLAALIVRICPEVEKPCGHANCHLRVICRCAFEKSRAAAAVEGRVWMVVTVCAAACLVYAVYAFLLG